MKGRMMANHGFGKIADESVIEAWQPKPLERLKDGCGLCLRAAPVPGRRHGWRIEFQYKMKPHSLSLGLYPNVSLELARDKALVILRQLAQGMNPGAVRKAEKADAELKREAERRVLAGEAPLDSFEDVARRWCKARQSSWSDEYAKRVLRRMELHLFPSIGALHISDITPPQVLAACRVLEERGTVDSAHRVKEIAGAVFGFGVGEGLREDNPCRDLGGLLQTPMGEHFAAITEPRQLADLLRAIPTYQGTAVVCAALKLIPMIFLRPGEFRQARWKEFDLHNGIWMVPSARMKRTKNKKLNGQPHYVPLARQAVEILWELHSLTGRQEFVFPAMGRRGRPMSDGTLNTAMEKLGYLSDVATVHGFRATARTLLAERLCIDRDVIELQLAHEVRDQNGRAYNRTEFRRERTQMMQMWADYLEDLCEGRIDYQTHADLPEFVPITERL